MSDRRAASVAADTGIPQTYQLHIRVRKNVRIQVGKLGRFSFPAGDYVYTGSARRNFEARVQRHLRKHKTLRWHIDYLLAHAAVDVVAVNRFHTPECRLNQQTAGDIPVPGFGSSDCKQACGSHLKRLA